MKPAMYGISVSLAFTPALLAFVLLSPGVALASDVRSFSTENEWNSTQINALGGIGHMSEEFVDQFFSDPSLPQKRKAKFELQFEARTSCTRTICRKP